MSKWRHHRSVDEEITRIEVEFGGVDLTINRIQLTGLQYRWVAHVRFHHVAELLTAPERNIPQVKCQAKAKLQVILQDAWAELLEDKI